jgi:hypothetical protein
MIDYTKTDFQENFLRDRIPPHTAGFYNSKFFAQNEMQILSSAVSVDDRAQQRGLQQIKDTINEG